MNKFFLAGIFCAMILGLSAFLQHTMVKSSSVKDPPSNQSFSKTNIIGCAPHQYKSTYHFPLQDSVEEIFANDNREAAGHLQNGIMHVDLEARAGIWFPETHIASGIRVDAFAEKGKPLQIPGPLIRIKEGVPLKITIHNLIKDTPLVIHGLYTRPSNKNDSIIIQYDKADTLTFYPGVAGTYYYKASASNLKDEDGGPLFNDSQLYGAFIVDPAHKKTDTSERIMMLGAWDDTLNLDTSGNEEFVINGLSWPYTERLTYHQYDTVRWRIINSSGHGHNHPMHLHGFFFNVNSTGNINCDSIYQPTDRPLVVTQLLKPGETMTMQWVASREGNWLFHCHLLLHIIPVSFLQQWPPMDDVHMQDVSMHALYDMTGLVMGIHVLPSKAQLNKDDKPPPDERHLTLIAREENNSKGFVLIDHNIPSNSGNIIIPGPPIVLTKDQPVSIKIINKLNEPTSLHWHGLEVESYYDGVAGWSNRGNELAPLIMPNDSFVVHILPNRAGTFIYHTHMTNAQVASGMYGALIVVNAGKKFDTAKDKVLFISTGGNDLNSSAVLLNGSQHPAAMLLKINQPYRFRIMDLNTITGYHAVSLLFKNKPVNWKAVAKDAVMLPPKEALIYKAFKQKIATGETRDFEFAPDKKGDYIFEVKNKDDKVVVAMVMNVR